MSQPSNNNIWGAGEIGVKAVGEKVALEVHYCTAMLSVDEALQVFHLLGSAINVAVGYELISSRDTAYDERESNP